MNFIELTMCTSTKETICNIIINTNSIIRIDDKNITKIWLKEFDSEIYVLESYAYLKYELTNCERTKK